MLLEFIMSITLLFWISLRNEWDAKTNIKIHDEFKRLGHTYHDRFYDVWLLHILSNLRF